MIASNDHDALLWARREDVASALNETHRNPDYLSDCDLNPALRATSSFAHALEDIVHVAHVAHLQIVDDAIEVQARAAHKHLDRKAHV